MHALILAGGKGERLRPLTDSLPKPMVPLDGRPLLWHQIRWLRSGGVTDATLLVGYMAEAIIDYFGDGANCGVSIQYHREERALGRGGALRAGLDMAPATVRGPVIAVNGDIITDANLGDLLADYDARSNAGGEHLATILTVPMASPYGIVDCGTTGLVDGFREKATLPYSINGGVYALAPGIRDLLPLVGDHEDSTFPMLARQGRMSAVRTEAFWRSVDSFRDLSEAETHLTGRRAA